MEHTISTATIATSTIAVTDSTRSEETTFYACEKNRLASFAKWPASDICAMRLAATGFFYVGKLDMVKCFECGLSIYQWTDFNNPICEHLIWSPNCRYVQGETSDKISLLTAALCHFMGEASPALSISDITQNLVSALGLDSVLYSLAVSRFGTKEEHVGRIYPSAINLARRKIFLRPGTINHDMLTIDARSKTFDGHPLISGQRARPMAEAGFYFTGKKEDECKCYCCFGSVWNWEVAYDPWIEHAIWFPHCHHLLTIKGATFVEQVSRLFVKSIQRKVKPCSVIIVANPDYATCQQMLHSEHMSDFADSIDSAPDRKLCHLCGRRPREMLIAGCMHVVVCRICIVELAVCPTCKDPITITMRLGDEKQF